jgi:hypothetical protein
MRGQFFMRELLGSVDTLTGIAEEHGPRTLADLMYLHASILDGGFIENHPEHSAVIQVVRGFASGGERWMKYIKNATTRTPEHQLVFDAMQPMEGLGRPDAQSYMRIMQAIVGEIDRLKLATQWPSASQNRSGPKLEDHHARASAPFILVNRALAEIGNRHLEGKFDRDYYLATLDAIQSDAYTRIGDARLNIQESRESNNRERSMDAAISAAARTPQSISPEHELVVVAMQPMEEMAGLTNIATLRSCRLCWIRSSDQSSLCWMSSGVRQK